VRPGPKTDQIERRRGTSTADTENPNPPKPPAWSGSPAAKCRQSKRLAFSREVPSAARASSGATSELDSEGRDIGPLPWRRGSHVDMDTPSTESIPEPIRGAQVVGIENAAADQRARVRLQGQWINSLRADCGLDGSQGQRG